MGILHSKEDKKRTRILTVCNLAVAGEMALDEHGVPCFKTNGDGERLKFLPGLSRLTEAVSLAWIEMTETERSVYPFRMVGTSERPEIALHHEQLLAANASHEDCEIAASHAAAWAVKYEVYSPDDAPKGSLTMATDY